MRAAIVAAVLAFASSPIAAQPQVSHFETISENHGVDNETQRDVIKFRRDDGDRMTVPVSVAGHGPWRFLVDTGADRTAISSQLAASLKLPSGSPAQVHSVTSVRTVATANVSKLQVSKNEVHNLNAPLLNAAHMGADGILGVDSLRSQRVIFDFENNLMSIIPAASYEAPSDPQTVIVYGRLRNGRLVLANAHADGNNITIVLDTGSDVCIGNEALRAQLERKHRLTSFGNVELQSVTGEVLHGSYTVVSRLKMGDVSLGKVAVVFADANIFRDLDLQDRPAILLGMNAMRAFKKVSIDFKNRKLRVVVPQEGASDSIMLADATTQGPVLALR
jgi:predicted aspartyl protease